MATWEIALDMFRRQYGVAARPEDHPKLWDDCLAAAQDIQHEMTDEGGEG